jgi:hypothetical protein
MPGMDFPASPTAGQLFISPTNGVTYQWSTTYTAWLPLSVTGAGQGDFCAVTTTGIVLPATATVMTPSVVQSGNSGGWYNTSTGRYTPPAGRYYLHATVTAMLAGSASNIQVALRKNGTNISPPGIQVPGAAFSGDPANAAIVDANGTDFFEFTAQGSGSPTTSLIQFLAFPITGAAQPAGTGSAWRQIGRVVPAVQAAIDFQNLPSDINSLEFNFDVTPVTNGENLYVAFYDSGGALDVTANHYVYNKVLGSVSLASNAAPGNYSSVAEATNNSILLNVNTAGALVGNVSGIRGHGHIPDIRSSRLMGIDWQCFYVDNGPNTWRQISGSGVRNVGGSITGLRFGWGSGGNFAAGGAVTLWGSP